MTISVRQITFAVVASTLVVAVSCRSSAPAPQNPPQETPKTIAEEQKPAEPPPEIKPPETAAPAVEEKKPVEPPPVEKDESFKEEPAVAAPPAEKEPEPFDPKSIPPEVFDSTKIDVQSLIQRLNSIIRAKDYETWVTFLGSSYRAALSDRYFLDRVSASTVLRKQQIILRELRDYFIHVVVPSRANDRVDDIEFIGQNRVKAFTVDSKGRRLRLYDLEKTPDGWEIIN